MIQIAFTPYADGTCELLIEDTTIPESISLELKLDDGQIKKLQNIIPMCLLNPAQKKEG